MNQYVNTVKLNVLNCFILEDNNQQRNKSKLEIT
jgi:hypothetical protein